MEIRVWVVGFVLRDVEEIFFLMGVGEDFLEVIDAVGGRDGRVF